MNKSIVTALLLWIVLVNAAQAADALQRLFTTPEQRAELERLRSHGVPQATETVEQAQKVELNGYIVRRDGKNVVWVNGRSTINKDESLADIQVDSKGISQQRVPVYLPEGKVSLKPGQVYARGVGTVSESYLVKDAPAVVDAAPSESNSSADEESPPQNR